MKRNVDLTEDRLFTTPPPQQDPGLIFIDVNFKPWEFRFVEITSDLDFGIDSQSLIPLGDKRDREIWKNNNNSSSNDICSTCGKRKYLPWSSRSCECYSNYSSTFTSKRFPWEF